MSTEKPNTVMDGRPPGLYEVIWTAKDLVSWARYLNSNPSQPMKPTSAFSDVVTWDGHRFVDVPEDEAEEVL